MPSDASQDRFSPAANSTYARAHLLPQESSSSSRSNWALPCQSLQASSNESRTPSRRCSGVSTRNSPPNDQNAWPPRLAALSWSTRATRLPAVTSSWVAARPARPAPTTITSVFTIQECIGFNFELDRVRRVRVTKRRAETRARLLAAAFRVFAAKGYGPARIDDVCAEAGYTRGAFYSN